MPVAKETQDAEGANREMVRAEERARGAQEASPQEIADTAEVFDDPVRGETPEPAPLEEAPAQIEEPKAPIDPRAAKRAEITARFRSSRNEEPDSDDYLRSGTPEGFGHPVPEIAPAEEAVVEEQPVQQQEQPQEQPQAQPQPTKIKVKVRGQEFEVSEDEYHAAAQKALAGDSYLDDAKARLNQADELYRDLQNRATHLPRPGEHHTGAETMQPGLQQPQPAADPQHPEDDTLAKAIEQIQYGDPAEAKQLLDTAVENRAAQVAERVVTNTLQQRQFKDEGARTAKVLADFEAQHPELAKDPMARAAIEAKVFDLQLQDLQALGVDPAKLPTKTGQVTPADIAQAHLWYRTQGYNVNGAADILQKAAGTFITWKGQPTGIVDPPADPNPDSKAPPRIAVQVDRNQRRQNIPQQPSRSAAPQRSAAQPIAQPRDRGSIVESMKALRNKPRGKVLSA